MITFKKVMNAAGSFLTGIVTFPFAVSYHFANPFYQFAASSKHPLRQRALAGTASILLGVVGLMGGVFFGILGLGALVGDGLSLLGD